jgi:anti-anti-sigma factor
MRGPEDFGAAFSLLLEAAGVTPDIVVRALKGTVSRSVLYDWKKGAHLPNDTRPLLEVVNLCLGLARRAGGNLQGVPGDVGGWMRLLAEAKQTRDNQADQRRTYGPSNLSALDTHALDEVVDFLQQHVKSLFTLMAGRPSPELARHVRDTGGRYQTPNCVLRPKILPGPDLAIAYERLDLLRGQLRNLTLVGNRYDRLLAAIAALRGALEEIHGVRIVFTGETITARNSTGSTAIGNSFFPADPGIDFDPRTQGDPITTRVRVLPGLSRATIVVEGNPPAAVTPSGSLFVVTVEARAPRAVILHQARVVVLDRRPPRRACLIKGIAGLLKTRRCDVDFDFEEPQLTVQGEHDFPFTVSPDDPEEFWVQAVTATNEITWTIALDWTVNGIPGTTLLNQGRPAFSLYPLDVPTGPNGQPLRRACDHGGHEEDCPALTLAQLGEPTSTFTPVRDLANECWLDAFETFHILGGGGFEKTAPHAAPPTTNQPARSEKPRSDDPDGGSPSVPRADRTVLKVNEDLDVFTAPDLQERLSALIRNGARHVVVDITGVEMVDSTAMTVLIYGLKRVNAVGGTLVLVCNQEPILKIFRITGLDRVFKIVSTLEDARPAAEG